ncbi:MAG TPA: glycoside hydrolase family 15 protein [Candidatus Binatia bacterium]|nr:glycoside hydrolase family 15 protein [Candidatus Binatia bacterium]
MALRLEDYALVGDNHTAALVGRDGSIDWLCLPRFDSGACFAALLGTPQHGRWLLAPAVEVRAARRRYRQDTLVLETDFEVHGGVVRVVDCMPRRTGDPAVVRTVIGVRGRVPMRMELVIRFDYGRIVPWVRRLEDGTLTAVAGPDALCLRTPIAPRGENLTTVARFTVIEGEQVPFVLQWHPSHRPPPRAVDPVHAVEETERWWRHWAARCTYAGPWREAVLRSLITLRALAYEPTGGIVAAPTTSLPEQPGGVRNWDYRYCWLRDAAMSLSALLKSGYVEEACAWRDWLLRAVAGDPRDLQIMYGPAGERRLAEYEVPWLPGYEGARPVRVGNAAAGQLQLDVYGEVLAAMHLAREAGIPAGAHAWAVELALLAFLEDGWREPDQGIWEVRGPRRHFTHSKVMAWLAFDRAVRAVERFGFDGPVARWRRLRDTIHAEVCARGWSERRSAFVQFYGGSTLDASLLMIPLVGFLPSDDGRVRTTVAAIERELLVDGFVRRYGTEESAGVDGLPAGEGAFLACTFWLADALALGGRVEDARLLFERLLALRNDVGLLAEEYDPRARRLMGNFPQAFSHFALVNTARRLAGAPVDPPPVSRRASAPPPAGAPRAPRRSRRSGG